MQRPTLVRNLGVYGMFTISGASALIYQVLWSRWLGLSFGNTTASVSIVLACFMSGLVLGSLGAGRVLHRLGNPMKAYAAVELGIGAFAVVFPLLTRLADSVFPLMVQPDSPAVYSLSVRAILSFLLLLVPTTLMGATLPLLTDFFGNHVPTAMTPILPIIQHAATGTIVPLAVTSTERVAALKDIPTFAEIGFPEMSGAIWFWLAGPKNLPAPVVEKLNAEMRKLINAPETRKQFEQSALLSMDADVPTLTKYVADELKRWTAFVEEKGLKK